jgi:NAD(P)H-flavin reductase
MELTKPQKFATKVIEKYLLTENGKYLLIKLELLEQNNTLVFAAGQYVSVKVGENGERRSYSIASTPDIDHAVTLVVEIVPGGKGSQFLQNVSIGENVEILAPLGKFVVGEGEDKLLFVATGSGLVPIYTMINDLLINKHESRQIRLHWGMRSEEDLFWFDNLGRLAESHENFVFDVVLSRPNEPWELCRGHVQDCLRRDLGKGELAVGWEAYVCGNQQMVMDVSNTLIELGMPKEKVRYEQFN